MDDLEPPKALILTPARQAAEGPPKRPVQGTHPQPELPLGDRWGQKQLPKPQGGEAFLVPGEDPLEKGRAASRKPHDEEGLPDLDLSVPSEKQVVQEESDPMHSLEKEKHGDQEQKEAQPLHGPRPGWPRGKEGQP